MVMISRIHTNYLMFIFAVLFSAAGSCFAETSSVTENTVPHSKSRFFLDKNRENHAVEVDVLVLSFEEYAITSNTLPPSYFTASNGLLQQQAALYLSRAILPYYTYSKTITPSLTSYELLFPFHSFS